MRRRLPLALALPTAATMLALLASPALAVPTTTPVPGPVDPGQPPFSAPNGPQPLGHAVGDAGTGLAVLRVLPGAAPTQTILPGFSDQLPKQAGAEVGFGLASAQANSEALLAYERAVAQSSPFGFAIAGKSPQSPGTLVQTALPDNPQPVSGGLNPPSTPLDALLKVGLLNGSVHARWNEQTGPCVGTISDAATELASLSLLNAIPSLPDTKDLGGLLTGDTSKLGATDKQGATDVAKQFSAPLSDLGGLLTGGATGGDGKGSLVSLPNTLSARSVVELVDIPGSPNKAVRSTSTFQTASVRLLAGTPFELTLNVVSQPVLRVTSTGDQATSKVEYSAPVLQVKRGDQVLYTLDAANPKADVPIAIPLPDLAGKLPDQFKNVPLVGDLGSLLSPAQLGSLGDLAKHTLDIGVLRLQIAELDQKQMALTAPFSGFQLGATARLLDLQILPTDKLGLPVPASALAQLSLGEQIARAAAPTGGVVCGSTSPAAPGALAAPAQPASTQTLAYTNASYQTVPMFWSGTAMLLLGVVIVSALPARRRVLALATAGPGRPPADTEPADAAAADAALADVQLAETAPADDVPADTAPGDAAPTETGAVAREPVVVAPVEEPAGESEAASEVGEQEKDEG